MPQPAHQPARRQASRLALSLLLLLLVSPLSSQTPIAGDALDEFMREGMAQWQMPGAAIAVVSGDQVRVLSAYGETRPEGGDAVTADTLFAIASTTKAMLATGLLLLEEQGRLSMDDLLASHLPELRFSDPWLSANLTLTDLLTHRTGLPSTDIWTFFQGFPLEQQLPLLNTVELATSPRSHFRYQNTMYELAGLVLERVSGMPWDEFLRQQLWLPLGMSQTWGSLGKAGDNAAHAWPYIVIDGELVQAHWSLPPDVTDAAGSVWSTARDMSRWVRFLLRGGTLEDGTVLLPGERLAKLFEPRMLIDSSSFYPTRKLTRPNWTSYGLGWFQQDFEGRKVDYHTGSLAGTVALVGLDRSRDTGMVILGNRDHAEMRHALLWRVMSSTPENQARDWNGEVWALYQGNEEQAGENWQTHVDQRVANTRPRLGDIEYTGTYTHPTWGPLEVVLEDDQLVLHSGRYRLAMSHWHYDTWLMQQPERDIRDLVTFQFDQDNQIQSLGFSGLEFTRQPNTEG